jgi:adenosylcobinamide-phosphate synthase
MPADGAVLLVALVVDGLLGDPDWLWLRCGHPVVWIGAAVERLERAWNRPNRSQRARRCYGLAALITVLALTAAITVPLTLWLHTLPYGWVIEGALAASLIAQRSLYHHVAAVARALASGGLAAGRMAVSRIVGRRPEGLDQAGVCRATIESLAENFSDGVVAPALWLVVGGLPGIALYKTVNTADSMIGHLDARYRDFGRAAARLDDVLNLPAARLAGLLLCAARPRRLKAALATMLRDARRHRSPNAGWPEAAMAGQLGLRLAGPRRYDGVLLDEPWLGDGTRPADPGDIRTALQLYLTACALLWGLAGGFYILLI